MHLSHCPQESHGHRGSPCGSPRSLLRAPETGWDGAEMGGPPGVMDSSSKATAAGKQRMVAKLTTCSSSPACSVRAP